MVHFMQRENCEVKVGDAMVAHYKGLGYREVDAKGNPVEEKPNEVEQNGADGVTENGEPVEEKPKRTPRRKPDDSGE